MMLPRKGHTHEEQLSGGNKKISDAKQIMMESENSFISRRINREEPHLSNVSSLQVGNGQQKQQ